MKGSYRLGAVIERFSADEERYVGIREDGDRVELTAGGRLEALHDGWYVRGGSVGDEVLWVRGDDEHSAKAIGFTGSSPTYDVALVGLLGLDVGQGRRVTLVEISEPVGAARTVEQGWARTGCDEPEVDRYEVADLQTGERWVVHLSGGVLISREGARTSVLLDLTR